MLFVSLSLFSLLLCLVLFFYLAKRYHLTREQKFIFFCLFLFWSSNVLIRAYRKSYALQDISAGGLALGAATAASIASAYGLASLLSRFGIYYLVDRLHSRKFLLLSGLLALVFSDFFVLYQANEFSLYASSFSLGYSASMLSLFNILFAQTFPKEQAMQSVSILSLAPLMAEFFMSSFQYFYTREGLVNYPRLWLISLLFALFAFLFLYPVKDRNLPKRSISFRLFKQEASQKNFWFLCIFAFLIALIKFISSGSNLIAYFQSPWIAMPSFWLAYSDFFYSFVQIFGGLWVGLYLVPRYGYFVTLAGGMALQASYYLVLLSSTSTPILFLISGLGGFSYGMLYNTLIGFVLQGVRTQGIEDTFKRNKDFDQKKMDIPRLIYRKQLDQMTIHSPEKNKLDSTKMLENKVEAGEPERDKEVEGREMRMAILQTFFALGIFHADKVYQVLAYYVTGIHIHRSALVFGALCCVIFFIVLVGIIYHQRTSLPHKNSLKL